MKVKLFQGPLFLLFMDMGLKGIFSFYCEEILDAAAILHSLKVIPTALSR